MRRIRLARYRGQRKACDREAVSRSPNHGGDILVMLRLAVIRSAMGVSIQFEEEVYRRGTIPSSVSS